MDRIFASLQCLGACRHSTDFPIKPFGAANGSTIGGIDGTVNKGASPDGRRLIVAVSPHHCPHRPTSLRPSGEGIILALEDPVVIQIFGTKKCKDTQKALRFFKERSLELQFRDIAEKAPSPGELDDIARAAGGFDALLDLKSAARPREAWPTWTTTHGRNC